jgi:hypothetical protein
MALIDEIIELAANDKEPIGNLLRKCLVLESQLPNESFRLWLDKELDGCDSKEDLPAYRLVRANSYGMFTGLASSINNQPLNLAVLKKDDRKWVEDLRLFQPASSYEFRPDKSADASIPWPPLLTIMYQDQFIASHTLLRAWQSLPGSVIVALLETVRNRVLRFALELRKTAGENAITSITSDAVSGSVDKHILAGQKFDWT